MPMPNPVPRPFPTGSPAHWLTLPEATDEPFPLQTINRFQGISATP